MTDGLTLNELVTKRRALGLTIPQMAKRCQCSELLLIWLESGDITHPNIASRVAHEYGLDVEGYNRLVHADLHVQKLPKRASPPTEKDYFKMVYRNKYK